MASRAYEGKLIEHCSNCLGHWVAKAKLQHVVVTRLFRFDAGLALQLAKAPANRTISAAESSRNLACPSCNVELAPRKFADDTPIVVNRCSACEGTWLDHHELEQVQMIVEAIDDLLRG